MICMRGYLWCTPSFLNINNNSYLSRFHTSTSCAPSSSSSISLKFNFSTWIIHISMSWSTKGHRSSYVCRGCCTLVGNKRSSHVSTLAVHIAHPHALEILMRKHNKEKTTIAMRDDVCMCARCVSLHDTKQRQVHEHICAGQQGTRTMWAKFCSPLIELPAKRFPEKVAKVSMCAVHRYIHSHTYVKHKVIMCAVHRYIHSHTYVKHKVSMCAVHRYIHSHTYVKHKVIMCAVHKQCISNKTSCF